MVAQLLHRLVLIAVVDDRSVVAGEDDEGVAGELRADRARRGSRRPTSPVARSHRRAGPSASCRQTADAARAAHADRASAKKRKNGLRPMLLDERDGLAGEDVGHVLVFPQRRLAARHVADPADPVDDRLVVSVAGLHREQVGFARAGRPVADRLAVADADGIGGIEAGDAAVLDVDGRHAVAGGGHDEAESKPTSSGPGRISPFQSRPACRSEPEMPLADDAGRDSRPAAEYARQRRAAGLDDQRGVAGQDAGARLAPRVFAGQQRVARRRARRGRRMRVGEPDAFAGERDRCSASSGAVAP